MENIKNFRINKINERLNQDYNIKITDYNILGRRSYKLIDDTNNLFFLKETEFNTLEKYHFLYNQSVSNILFPFLNKNNNFVSSIDNHNFYINRYINDFKVLEDYRVKNMFNELNNLHNMTSFKKQLDPKKSRNRFDELSNQLDYKFKIIEDYIRSLEIKQLEPSMMMILGNYQYILDAKKELIRLQKRIISSVKAKESVTYSFIHNNPTLDHLINENGNNYLTSIDKGKVGICSLDIAKFYIENKNVDVDLKYLINDYFNSNNNPFYYDYFRFLVLVIYIKGLNVNNDNLTLGNQFKNVSENIKIYFNDFKDINYEE